ncbi:hypothetical protein [Aquimarina algiphila]|uniref:Uncharacterized protein n=1 Tax=Aquimarina algiphila TaxID=2047982 RepID=A0A554VI29_9FLAO|nr:hypothetical protein [Aquimarina algiphila]TSE07284.1 hypothetical protein FOF46_16525 [Aquimarina algiphila]
MGIHKVYYTEEKIDIKSLNQLFENEFGDKYTYKSSNASNNAISKVVSGKSNDAFTVIKNAYHRTVISLQDIDGKTYINFGEDTLEWWLNLLNNNFGFIGSLIIRLIYGDGDGFYDEIQATVKNNLQVEEQEIKVGLGALFGNK